MNKKEIFEYLKKFELDKEEFIVLSGAALVIYGIKEVAKDIDIAVSEKLYNKLINNYNCTYEKEVNTYKVWYIDNIINFSINYYDEVSYEIIDGYKIQDLDSIIKLKQKLNRSKDKQDIERILEYKKTTY